MTPAAFALLDELGATQDLEVGPSGEAQWTAPRVVLTPALLEEIHRHKANMLAALSMEGRLAAMFSRNGYSDEDRARALRAARLDPAAWLTTCAADEELHAQLNLAPLPLIVPRSAQGDS